MINITDLSECEVLLPGDWRRKDTLEIYSFTAEKMELKDGMLFRQLLIRDGVRPARELLYALIIKGDYCGVRAGDKEFIIEEIVKRADRSYMRWADESSTKIEFSAA